MQPYLHKQAKICRLSSELWLLVIHKEPFSEKNAYCFLFSNGSPHSLVSTKGESNEIAVISIVISLDELNGKTARIIYVIPGCNVECRWILRGTDTSFAC